MANIITAIVTDAMFYMCRVEEVELCRKGELTAFPTENARGSEIVWDPFGSLAFKLNINIFKCALCDVNPRYMHHTITVTAHIYKHINYKPLRIPISLDLFRRLTLRIPQRRMEFVYVGCWFNRIWMRGLNIRCVWSFH